MRYGVVLAAALAFGALIWLVSDGRADYPAAATVTAGASDASPAPGSAVTITCTVFDADGAPLAGQPCTFSIVSAPGGTSFAGSQSATAYSDSNGAATAVLSTGSTPGTITVRVESGGVSSQTTLNTGGAQELPSTGASSASDTKRLLLLIIVAAAVLAAAGTMLITLLRRRA